MNPDNIQSNQIRRQPNSPITTRSAIPNTRRNRSNDGHAIQNGTSQRSSSHITRVANPQREDLTRQVHRNDMTEATRNSSIGGISTQAERVSQTNRTAPETPNNSMEREQRRWLSFDPRTSFLQFIESHSLSLSCIFTALLVALTVFSIIEEYENTCDENIQLWLLGTAARAFFATGVKLYIECINRQYISNSGNVHMLNKISEMLDVFGVVWFCIGNLLVFNDSSCKRQTPLIFNISLTYIVLIYFLILSNMVIRASLAICPTDVDMRDWQPDRIREDSTSHTIDWKSWLESYGCNEMTYKTWKANYLNQNKLSPSSTRTKSSLVSSLASMMSSSVDVKEVEGDRGINIDMVAPSSSITCPICLSDFEDCRSEENAQNISDHENQLSTSNPLTPVSDINQHVGAHNLVVSFPCSARHLFHTICLHSWLSVANPGSQRLTTVTCPVCRERLGESMSHPYRRIPTPTQRNDSAASRGNLS